MKLIQSILLALVLGGMLHAAPLNVDVFHQPNDIVFVVTGPRGPETYHREGFISQVTCCFLNDRWQVVFEDETDFNLPRWFLINYGRGPGDYGDLRLSGNRIPTFFSTPELVPGFVVPDTIIGGTLFDVRFQNLDNHGILSGTAHFHSWSFDPTPGVDPDGMPDDIFMHDPLVVPFTLDAGANPFFVPEPGSLLLVGLGLLGTWRVRRRR